MKDNTSISPLRKIVAFSASVEIATGIALLIVPTTLAILLFGWELVGTTESILIRCFGLGLLILGVACWPHKQIDKNSFAYRALLIYNALIALCLTFLATFWHLEGLLLWPVVALHSILTLLFLRVIYTSL